MSFVIGTLFLLYSASHLFRPGKQDVITMLKGIGADVVVLDSELRSRQVRSQFDKNSAPSLALNCIGGQNATDLARLLR